MSDEPNNAMILNAIQTLKQDMERDMTDIRNSIQDICNKIEDVRNEIQIIRNNTTPDKQISKFNINSQDFFRGRKPPKFE